MASPFFIQCAEGGLLDHEALKKFSDEGNAFSPTTISDQIEAYKYVESKKEAPSTVTGNPRYAGREVKPLPEVPGLKTFDNVTATYRESDSTLGVITRDFVKDDPKQGQVRELVMLNKVTGKVSWNDYKRRPRFAVQLTQTNAEATAFLKTIVNMANDGLISGPWVDDMKAIALASGYIG